jgi:small subunit ribosomal protein S25e
MGGGKKPSGGKTTKPEKKESKKGKKGESGPRRAEIIVMVNEQQAMKIIQNSKVITVQDLARQVGVKISAANAFLKESLNKGTVKRVGGYSGHHLYQSISS